MPAPRASIIFDADNKALHEATNQNLRDLQNQSREAAALGRTVGNLVSTFFTYQTVLGTLRAAKQGEEFLNARREFGKYVNDVEAGSARLSQAVRGTVDNMRLLQLANEGFRQGLDFSTVETALRFAEQQSDRTPQTIEAVFEQVARALAKTEAGVGRNNTVLVQYGITGANTVEILRQMERQLSDVSDELDDNSDAVAQAEARWTNATLRIGESIRRYILPALDAAGRKLEELTPGTELSSLSNISDRLSAFQYNLRSPLFNKSLIGNTLDELNKLRTSVTQGTAATSDFERVLALISEAEQKNAGTKFGEQLAYARVALEKLLAVRNANVRANIPFGPDERDAQLNQELLDKIAAEQKAAAEQAKALRDQELQQKRDTLQQQRDLKKAEIALGQATYADLGQLLDQQQADNQAFLDSDVQAKIAWMQDSALVYQQDKANAEREAAGKYNTYQRYIDGVLNSEALSQEERYQKALEAVNGALELEQFDMEQRRVLYGQKQQLEQDYRNFVLQNYAEQVQLLQNLFGEPTLQLLDSFFTQSEVKFEEYLKNLVRMLARYALQMGLLRLFGMILGNPLSVAPIPGSPTDFLPGASIPRLPDLTTLPAGTINTITGNNPRNPGQPQINVSLGVDKEQLYVLVKSGQEQYNRTTFSAK